MSMGSWFACCDQLQPFLGLWEFFCYRWLPSSVISKLGLLAVWGREAGNHSPLWRWGRLSRLGTWSFLTLTLSDSLRSCTEGSSPQCPVHYLVVQLGVFQEMHCLGFVCFPFFSPPRSEMLMCWNQNLTRGRRDSQKFLSGAIWGRRAEEQSLKWLKGICMNNFQCGILIAMTFYFEMQIDYRIAQLLPCELLEVVCTWRALYSEQKHIICYQVGEWIMLRAF